MRYMPSKSWSLNEIALAAINMEQNILGEAVGSQDQTAAAFGEFNLIEFDAANNHSSRYSYIG